MVADKFAEPPDGPSSRALSTMAKDHQLWIIAGLSMRREGQYLNSALAFAPDGSLVATYDKQRLFGYAKETTVYSAGTSPCVIQVGGLSLGLFVCFDLRFPELFREVRPRSALRHHRKLAVCPAATLGGSHPGAGDRESVLRRGSQPDRRWRRAGIQRWLTHPRPVGDALRHAGAGIVITDWRTFAEHGIRSAENLSTLAHKRCVANKVDPEKVDQVVSSCRSRTSPRR